ncbi:MAG: tetratricopeptide repeat protein [Bacteroidales bacterium]|nr:tetratricopeptide repeat protein [Bacteroidales bacterium]
MKKVKWFFILTGLILISIFSCGKKIVPALVAGKISKTFDSAAFDYIYVEAIKEKLMGNSGEALKDFEQSLELNPESDAAYYQMAQILIANRDIKNGKKYALKAVSIEPENIWYLMMLAGTYYQEKNLDSAIIYYEKAVKYYPEKESLRLTLGNLYSENKNYDKASEIFNALDKKYGINEASTLSTVKNLMFAGDYGKALERILLLLKQYPDEILYNGLLAEIYRGKGEKEKAMEVYNQLIQRNPDNPETLLSLCDFLIKEKIYDEFLQLLDTIVLNTKISREDKIALFAQLTEESDLIKAYGDKLQLTFTVLESTYENDEIIVLLRPELSIKQGKLDDAALRLEEIIKKQPENYYAWEKLLLVYLQQGDYKKLLVKGEECATKFNRSFLAKLLYANGAMENGKFIVALEELRKANILAGENKDLIMQVLSMKASVYYKMKDLTNTFETFEEALKNNSEDLTILNNYAYYLAEQNMRLKEAEIMAGKVIEKEKTNATFLDTYAWVLYKRGKLKEAAKIMESIIKNKEENDAEYLEHYGYILKKQKNCAKATENWKKAIELDSTKTNLLKEIENCIK